MSRTRRRADQALLNQALALTREDWRGVSRLVVDAAVGVTDLAETLHQTVTDSVGRHGGPLVRPVARLSGRIAGSVYGAVRSSFGGVGGLLDLGLGWRPSSVAGVSSAERDAFVAALNGVVGDRLAARGNPLALPLTLRIARADAGQPPSPQLLLLVHGLCMNDRQWCRQGHDHGRELAQELGFDAVYARYNSGRHVSENGRDLAFAIETLVERWPVPVERIVIVGHSLGGLVARSACQAAGEAGLGWPARLRHIVCLGTPHHGAPLERAGRLVDEALAFSRYVEPFARLGRARSAGITDLRWGNLRDADWQGRPHSAQRHDDRVPTPPPAGVALHVVAALLARRGDAPAARLVGDGLVPLASALGEHADPALDLGVPAARRLVLHGANHWDLLSRPEVYRQLSRWLAGS
ncbi:lipase family alpha/beta hydrolase [Rubrivivax gelatinosus]|uniref:GPI inositol-deacylase PGAP1-like alpha/beta domain-containing protein n=1 Tax=Rubrivivax gelatinosus TaxID=28068 RepID=A0ABS1DZY8_RUBGE|nr:alpha/beta hydrolase [Rubrivivax gelatinosus]MBK1715677.1 hypothetical protein [Rubrivivax gelatinosus]